MKSSHYIRTSIKFYKYTSFSSQMKTALMFNLEFKWITWTMYRRDSTKAEEARKMAPMIQLDWGNRRCCGIVDKTLSMRGGPLNRVTMSAPIIETNVPINFALLLMTLSSTFSILWDLKASAIHRTGGWFQWMPKAVSFWCEPWDDGKYEGESRSGSLMVEDRVGELYPIPMYTNNCRKHLREHDKIFKLYQIQN